MHTHTEACCCYLADDRFPCSAAEHENLEEALTIVRREARLRARRRFDREDFEPGAEEWTGDIYDVDLDTTAEEIGRQLSGEEIDAFTTEFRRRFAELARRGL